MMHGEFMAFVHDEASANLLRGWAGRQGFPDAVVQIGGPDMFAQMLEEASPPKMAVVDVDGPGDQAAIAARLVSLCGPDCKLVIIGSANDVTLYRKMISAGAVDYLVKPLAADMVGQALTAALRGNAAGKEAHEARLITVIGSRGGVGASTIAVNVAWLMAHQLKLNTVLLDLDMQFGTSALSLDLEPGRGLRDIVSSPHRVDGLMIASSIVAESEHLSVLGAEEAVDDHVTMDSGAISALLKEMMGNFDCVIVDLPRHLIASQKRLLASAHEIIIATELSLAGIRDTLRIKTALNAMGSNATVTVVASRTGQARIGHVDLNAFEKGAQIKINLQIPEEPKTVMLAANSGKALGEVAKNAGITKAMLNLAHKVSGALHEDHVHEGSPFLHKLLAATGRKPPVKSGDAKTNKGGKAGV